jgi:hypothetical protein
MKKIVKTKKELYCELCAVRMTGTAIDIKIPQVL